MALYDDSEDAPLQEAYTHYRWFEHVLEFEYGERDSSDSTTLSVPDELNWLRLLPATAQVGLDAVECSLYYQSETSGYSCTVWDVTGEDDLPWVVFLVDDFGPRLLTEFSVLDEDAENVDALLEETLSRTADELPARLRRGDFDRIGTPLVIPAWLDEPGEVLPES